MTSATSPPLKFPRPQTEGAIDPEPSLTALTPWWRRPTCYLCGAYLSDTLGNPQWEVVDPDLKFICLERCKYKILTERNS